MTGLAIRRFPNKRYDRLRDTAVPVIFMTSVMTAQGVMTARRIDMTGVMAARGVMTAPPYRFGWSYDRFDFMTKTSQKIRTLNFMTVRGNLDL